MEWVDIADQEEDKNNKPIYTGSKGERKRRNKQEKKKNKQNQKNAKSPSKKQQ